MWVALGLVGLVAPTADEAKGVAFEKFTKVDATLPKIPAGPVKKFKVDVYQHVTHAFGDAVKGAIGVLATANPPAGAGHDMGGGAKHSMH
jgi:hypothetical protein